MTDQLDLSLNRLRRAIDQATMPKPVPEAPTESPITLIVPTEPDPTTPATVPVAPADVVAHSPWTNLIRRLFGR